MAYGTIKVDTITFTDGGIDKSVAISGLVQNPTFTGNVTVTGTVSGNTVQGQTISGVTVTGTTANFVSGVFTTQISGATVTGTTANFTSGNFTNISGGTHTITSGVFAAGTAANPSISFASDPNTGIYSPGADQVAISTNGTGRLFIDASGNVKIGSTDNSNAGSQYIAVGSVGVADGGLQLWSRTTGSSYVQFGDTTTAADQYRGYLAYLHFDDALTFGTASTERMRLDSSGRLGLGTSSPGSLLDLVGGDIRLNSVYGINKSNADGYIHLSGGTSNALGGTIFCFGQSHAGNANEIHFRNSGNQTRVVIDSSGRVGIGTTSPQEELHISSASNPYIQVQGTGTTAGSAYYGWNSATGSASIESTGSIRFAVPGLEAARIDSSGRLLVGTSTARETSTVTWKAQIEGTNELTGLGITTNQNGGAGAYLSLAKSRGTTIGSNTIVAADDALGAILFSGADGTDANTQAATIICAVDGTPGANDMPGRLVFSTTADGASSPTERVRIKSDGVTSFGQGATGPGSGVAGTLINAGDGGILITNNTNPFLRCYTLNGGFPDALQIAANGNVTNANNSYGAISDVKLKENIVDANSQWNDLKAFRVRNYNLKEGQTHTQIGLIAQEAELVSPGIVSESPDCDAEGNDLGTVTKSVNYSVLYMKAVKALQEAMERIETLEAKVAALEGV